jgi:hypothetical protein
VPRGNKSTPYSSRWFLILSFRFHILFPKDGYLKIFVSNLLHYFYSCYVHRPSRLSRFDREGVAVSYEEKTENFNLTGKGIGKVLPRTDHGGPEGE